MPYKDNWTSLRMIQVDTIFIICTALGVTGVSLITLTLLLIALGKIEV